MTSSGAAKVDWRTLAFRALPYLVCCIPTIVYQILYVNAYYPITEGWFVEYAHLIRTGAVPYVDFPLLLPPLYPLQLAAIQSVFGDNLAVLHCIGILVTAGIALALFDILRGFVNEWIAALAAAFGVFYYQSGVAFINYDYTQFLTLYLLVAAAAFARYIRWQPSSRLPGGRPLLCALTGGFLALAILIKQSNASVAAIFVTVAALVVVARLNPLRTALVQALAMLCGFAIPMVALLLWLALHGAVPAFVQNVLSDATQSKGGILHVFTSWEPAFFAWDSYSFWTRVLIVKLLWVVGAMASIAVLIEAGRLLLRRAPFDATARRSMLRRLCGLDQAEPVRAAVLFAVLGTIAICAVVIAIYRGQCWLCSASSAIGQSILDSSILWAVNLYCIGFFVALVWFCRRPDSRGAQYVVAFALGLGLTLGNGTSAGLSEISAFLGLTMLAAFLMRVWLPYVLPTLIPVALGLSLCALLVEAKFASPYHWWQVSTPDVRHVSCADTTGIFSGICMPADEYAAIMRIDRDIQANSSGGEPVYVYPHMPIFYLLAGRPPFAGAVVSWYDFMSDREAKNLAARLLVSPPRVVVFANIPEIVLSTHERLFRGGRRIGQRDIVDAMTALTRCHLLGRIDRVGPLSGLWIDVYAAAPRALAPEARAACLAR
jgi:hypothetical protein